MHSFVSPVGLWLVFHVCTQYFRDRPDQHRVSARNGDPVEWWWFIAGSFVVVFCCCWFIKQHKSLPYGHDPGASQAHGQTSTDTKHRHGWSQCRTGQVEMEPGTDMPTLRTANLCVNQRIANSAATQENGRAKQAETRAQVALASVTECSFVQLLSSWKHCRQKLGIFKSRHTLTQE